MNDVYCEYIIKRKTGSWALFCRFFVVLATAFAMFFGFIALQFYGLFGGLLLIYLSIYVFRNTDIEYKTAAAFVTDAISASFIIEYTKN